MRALTLLMFPSLALAGQFKVPDGWSDLTAERLNTEAVFFAGDTAHRSPNGGMANAVALIRREPTPVNQISLAAFAKGLELGAAKEGHSMAVVDSKIVDFNGVSVMRVALKGHAAGIDARWVVYLLPMGERTAILTYTTEAAKLAEYEPVFDAAARATTGLAATPLDGGEVRLQHPVLVASILSLLIVAGIVVFVVRRKRA